MKKFVAIRVILGYFLATDLKQKTPTILIAIKIDEGFILKQEARSNY
jgi:hypothetical protein